MRPHASIVSSSRSSLILPSLPKWRPAIAAQRLSLPPIFDGALFDDEACAFEPARSRYGPCSNALPSQRISPNYRKKGWRGLARHPPRPTPVRRRRRLGNGGDRPITCQALPSGSATKRVPSFDFTRNNSVCLPSLRASEICLRTSAGLETDLPLTSRMTSPTWKP